MTLAEIGASFLWGLLKMEMVGHCQLGSFGNYCHNYKRDPFQALARCQFENKRIDPMQIIQVMGITRDQVRLMKNSMALDNLFWSNFEQQVAAY